MIHWTFLVRKGMSEMSSRIKELTTENGTVHVHPVKTMKATPTVDWSGNPMPTELDQYLGKLGE